MGRSRVLSFIFPPNASREPTPSPSPPSSQRSSKTPAFQFQPKDTSRPAPYNFARRPVTPPSDFDYSSPLSQSPPSNSFPESPLSSASSTTSQPQQRSRRNSRPLSISGGYQPPLMEVNEDTIPELLPIYALLNTHSNKLYQEGYFLKLEDQNTQGKANADRAWTECFAQLVGTVLSLWDAAELDAAGEDGEVLPKFINLTDASLKMIDSLPTRSSDEQPLQNILSLSTAGKNRYLLHFNSHHALVQWTAAVRLAIFEYTILQEAYTGALVAGKAKYINNIGVVMERSRFKIEEWVRVRFGAGVPWRRCWCVITPPDEKEVAKMQKEMKKKSPYDRSHPPVLKGDIRFYDQKVEGKKQKKLQPIASIHDAYSAFSIYPQAKSLVDASTLIKIEGSISIHTDPPSVSEGFVFVMPETRPMVTGFETMLRFLFPAWDTFGLYGRPGKLVASTLDSRSLMFAMPKSRKYGYLELLDVSSLIVDTSSSTWDEREWRKRLKEATGKRMNDVEDGVKTHARSGSNQSNKLKVGFASDGPGPFINRTSRSFSLNNGSNSSPSRAHGRTGSDSSLVGGSQGSPLRKPLNNVYIQDRLASNDSPVSLSGDEQNPTPPHEIGGMRSQITPDPVSRPPTQNRGPAVRPNSAYHSPELRRANSRLSVTTLAQIAKAGGLSHLADDGAPQQQNQGATPPPVITSPVHTQANPMGNPANDNSSREGYNPSMSNSRPGFQPPPPLNLSAGQRSRSPNPNSPYAPQSLYSNGPGSRPGTSDGGRRSPYPPRGRGNPPQSPLPPQGRGGPGPPGPPQHGGRGLAPISTDPYGRGRGGSSPGRGGPQQGPGGGGYPTGQGRGAFPGWRPTPGGDSEPPRSPYRDSVTPNVIIDHYTSDKKQQAQAPPPPMHQSGLGKSQYNAPQTANYENSEVGFGSAPTSNYGAPQPPRHQNGLNPPGSPRLMQRPNTSQGRDTERPPIHRQRSDNGEQQNPPWNQTGHGPPVEEYAQQRGPPQPQYRDGGFAANGESGDSRMGASGYAQVSPYGPQAGQGSFSRPLRADARSPPQSGEPRVAPFQGQYSSRPGTPSSARGQPPYQGQAF